MSKWLLIPLLAIVLFSLGVMWTPVTAADTSIAIRGNSVVLTAALEGTAPPNTSFKDQTIEFFDETHNLFIGANKTDENGLAWFRWNIPSDYYLGPILVNATFRGNFTLALSPSVQYIDLSIFSATILSVTIDQTLVAPYDELEINVTLIDELSGPLANTQVHLMISGVIVKSALTDQQGIALFDMICNSSWLDFGENSLEIYYPGNETSYLAPASYSRMIVLEKKAPTLSIFADNTTLTINDSLNVDASLVCPSENMSNNPIQVALDNMELGTYYTNKNGNITVSVLLGVEISLGEHSLVFTYPGSERYSPVSTYLNFTVSSHLVLDLQFAGPCLLNASTNTTIYTFDEVGRPLSGVLVLEDLNTTSILRQNIANSGVTIISLRIAGNPGIHLFRISIDNNPFVINPAVYHNFVLLSRPSITELNSSILGFASPGQEFSFYVQVENETTYWSNGTLRVNGTNFENELFYTNNLGVAVINLKAPLTEGNYCIVVSVVPRRFETPTTFWFQFFVRKQMPIDVNLYSYRVISSLQSVEVIFSIYGLNGTPLDSLGFHYEWLSHEGLAHSENGMVVLNLAVPPTDGSYPLFFSVDSSSNILGTNGSFSLVFSNEEILSSQGVGITPFILSIAFSVALVGLSIIRRKLTID